MYENLGKEGDFVMSNMIEMQNLLGANEVFKWIASTVIFSILYALLNIYVFKTLLNVKIKSNTIVYLLLADSLFKALCSIFIPAPYYRVINMFLTVVLFRLFTRTEYRKMHY